MDLYMEYNTETSALRYPNDIVDLTIKLYNNGWTDVRKIATLDVERLKYSSLETAPVEVITCLSGSEFNIIEGIAIVQIPRWEKPTKAEKLFFQEEKVGVNYFSWKPARITNI